MCLDLQERIVREVEGSASLARLRKLADLSSSFQGAYMARLSRHQHELVQAGLKLPTPQMLPALLALLHRHMTGHPLLYTPCLSMIHCVCCGFPRVAHRWDDTWPWLLRCPAGAEAPLASCSLCFIPSLFEELGMFVLAVLFQLEVHMMPDGSLEDVLPEWGCSQHGLERYERSGELARDAWWEGCREEGASRVPRRKRSCVENGVRALLTRPVVVGIPGVLRPRIFGESVLTVKLSGYGSRRKVVMKTKVLGLQALLGFVLSLGQGAQLMQREAWLRLEIRLVAEKCQPDVGEVLDSIVSLMPLCQELALGGPDGLRKLLSPRKHTHAGAECVLFQHITFSGLGCEVIEGLSDLRSRKPT
jgi:hypothetical protein